MERLRRHRRDGAVLRIMSVIAPRHPDALRPCAPGQQQPGDRSRAQRNLQPASNPFKHALSHVLTREPQPKDTRNGFTGQAESRSSMIPCVMGLAVPLFPRGASPRGTSLAWEANAYITGSVNEDLLRRIEYLLEPSSILPFVDDEERKRSLWFRGDGRQMDWAVEPCAIPFRKARSSSSW